jgi:hypothetical protein
MRALTFVLLPALSSETSPASVPASHRTSSTDRRDDQASHELRSQPYLAAIGPKALRFAEPPLPVPVTAPPPPRPLGYSTPVPADVAPAVPATPAKDATATAQPAKPDTAATAAPAKAPDRVLVPLLPDDTRQEVRPEDILPFFQFPGANGSTTVIRAPLVPMAPPPAIPTSSATYTQK